MNHSKDFNEGALHSSGTGRDQERIQALNRLRHYTRDHLKRHGSFDRFPGKVKENIRFIMKKLNVRELDEVLNQE